MSIIRFILAFAALAGATASTAAQEWPTRPIQVLVQQSAGSANDIVTRAVMEQLSMRLERIERQILVSNRYEAVGRGISEDRVAVGLCARDCSHRDRIAGADAIFNNDRATLVVLRLAI